MPRPRKRKTRYSTGGGGARKTRRGRRKSQLPFLEDEELNKEKEKQWWELSEGGEEEEEEEEEEEAVEEEEVNYDHDEDEEDEWQAMARPSTKRRLRRLRRNRTLPKLFADWYGEPMLFFVPPMLGRSAIVRLIEKYGGALSDTPPMVKEEDPLVKSVEGRERRRREKGNDKGGEEEEKEEEQEEHENVEEEENAPQRVYYLLPPTEGRLPAPTIGNAYSAKFVVDCVKAKRRLAISDYLIPRNKPQSIPDRNIFLPEEEEIMIRYVEKHGENFTPTGNILWRNMSRDGLCPRHTPVSMRNHWRRKLYPRLQLDYPSSPFASPNNVSSKRRSSMPYSLPEDEFTGMTLIQLRAALKDRGLHTNGNKPDLLRRLREYKEEQERARKQRRKERRERGEPSESEEEGEEDVERNGEEEEGTDEETQVLMSQVEEVLERGNVASEDEEEDGEEDEEEEEVQAKKRKQAKKTKAQKQQPQKKRIAKRKRRGKQQSEATTTKEQEPEKEKEKEKEVEAMQQEVAESEEVEEVEEEVKIYEVRKRQRQQEMEELATRESEKQREEEDEEEEAEEEQPRPIKPKTPTKTSRQMRRLQKEEQLQTERLENIRRKSMQQSVAKLNIHKLQNTTGCSEKLVIHALWVFSGDVGKARKYLTLFDTEPDSESRMTCIVEELKPWSIEEDKMLMRSRPKDLQALIEARGSANVFERIRFLMP